MSFDPKNFISNYPQTSLLVTVISIYFIFFELMLPGIYFIPKPSELYNSFMEVFKNYPLKSGFLDTFILVISSSILVYFISKITGVIICYIYLNIPSIKYLTSFTKYILPVFLMAGTIVLFEASYIIEFLFLCAVIKINYSKTIYNSLDNISYDSIQAYKTLPGKNITKLRNIYWKHTLTDIKKGLPSLTISLWGYAILYEIIAGSRGVGSIINLLVEFKDYYGLFSVMVFLAGVILIMEAVIKYAIYKSNFWVK